MQPLLRKARLSLILCAAIGFTAPASATIVLTDADFTDSSFTFRSTGAQLATGPNFVNGATYASQNMDWITEGSGQNFASPWYYDGAGEERARFFILGFDFSQVTTQVDSFTINYDRVIMFPDVANTLVSIEWSTDLSSWNLLRSVASITGQVVNSENTGGPTISLNGADALYYRVRFSADNPALPTDFAGNQTQWGRSDTTDTAFEITFTSVPEPSTWALLIVFGVAALGMRKLRRLQNA